MLLMRFFIAFIFYILFSWQVAAQQSGSMSILQIFDQYVISKGAALACQKEDLRLDAKYDERFEEVYKAAWVRLRKLKKSDVSNDEISTTLDRRIKSMHEKVAKDAAKEGCEVKSYKELLNLYQYHANTAPPVSKNQ